MGFKIRNLRLAGLSVIVSTEEVLFDADGVAELESEEVYNSVVILPNFSAVEPSVEELEQARLAQEEADKLAQEEADKLAQEEADKLAKAVKATETKKK